MSSIIKNLPFSFALFIAAAFVLAGFIWRSSLSLLEQIGLVLLLTTITSLSVMAVFELQDGSEEHV